jgi:hypothetical protein
MIINCEERYREALEHAQKTGDNTLQACLDSLKQKESKRECEITLYYDRTPLSFYFEMKDRDGNRVMNGGVLYHGDPDESRGFQLTPSKGWQIHT